MRCIGRHPPPCPVRGGGLAYAGVAGELCRWAEKSVVYKTESTMNRISISILTAFLLLVSVGFCHSILAKASHHSRTLFPSQTVITTSSPRVNPLTRAVPKQWSPGESWVAEALQAEPRMRGSHILVTQSSKEDMTLSGTVPHKFQRKLARRIAMRALHANSENAVVNHITIR